MSEFSPSGKSWGELSVVDVAEIKRNSLATSRIFLKQTSDTIKPRITRGKIWCTAQVKPAGYVVSNRLQTRIFIPDKGTAQ